MTRTDKDERCHCDGDGRHCPHCGQSSNADHRARCHRESLGLKPAVVAERAALTPKSWRGPLPALGNDDY